MGACFPNHAYLVCCVLSHRKSLPASLFWNNIHISDPPAPQPFANCAPAPPEPGLQPQFRKKWTCLQLSTKNLPTNFQNLLTPHLEAILKVTFKLLGTSASFTTVFALPEILPQWVKLLGHWLKNLCSIMGWYLASFLCFSLRCSSRLLADFSKRFSRVDRIFLKFPRQPLEIFYFICHNFLSGSFSPHVVFVNALQLFHSPLVFPLLLSDLKQPKQNCIVSPLLSFSRSQYFTFYCWSLFKCSSKVFSKMIKFV